MDKGPVAAGVMVTEQVAEAPAPDKMHVPPGVKVTVPVGVVGPSAVSVTVAMQLVAWLMTTIDGVQLRVVEVASGEGPADADSLTLTMIPEMVYVPK